MTRETKTTPLATIVTANLNGATAKVTVVPSRNHIVRLQTGYESTGNVRTLGEIPRVQAYALLDALTAALDETASD